VTTPGNLILPPNVENTLSAAVGVAQEQALALDNSLASSSLGQAITKFQAAVQATMGYIAVKGCTPKNGAELRLMIENTTCTRLTLEPATNYSITEQLVIRRHITLVGRPLGLPIIDAHNTTRAFLVEAGGFLDVRFVQIVKGNFLEVTPRVLYRLRGPTCYIRRGGVALFTGCRFTTDWLNAVRYFGISPPQATVQVFGGGIVLESGTLRVTDCHRVKFHIGVAFREIEFIGGEFLVLTGSMYMTGCIFVDLSLFSNGLGAGGYVANLGGTVIITGCLFNYLGAFVCTNGLGYLFFLGGGTTVVTGSILTTVIGFAAYFGGGVGIFTGSGVAVMTGFIYSAQGTMGIGTGLGFHMAVGSGISIRTGIIISSVSALGFLAGCGLKNYVGAGLAVFSEVSLARSTALLSFYGCGSYLYLGAGIATLVNSVGFFVTGISSYAYVGGDMAILAGYVVRVNQIYTSVTAISFAVGQGADLFVGLGGATLILNLYIAPPPPIYYRHPGMVSIYVAGNNVFVSNRLKNSTTLFGVLTVNKHGQTEWQKNIFVARMVSWRYTDQGPFPGDFVVDRRLKTPETKSTNASVIVLSGDHITNAKSERSEEGGKELAYLSKPFISHFSSNNTYDIKPMLLAFLNKFLPIEGEEENTGRGVGKGSHFAMRRRMWKRSMNSKVQERVTQELPNRQGTQMAGINGSEEGVADKKFLPDVQNSSRSRITESSLYDFADLPGLKVEHTKTDKIYVASPLDTCGVCDISPGNTVDNIDGPGALSSCGLQNKCSQSNPSNSTSSISVSKEEIGLGLSSTEGIGSSMWTVGREDKPANSTVQQLHIHATFTLPIPADLSPSRSSISSAGLTKDEVHAALRGAIATLGLSDRYHLRVESFSKNGKGQYPWLRWKDSADASEMNDDMIEGHDFGSIDPAEIQGQPCQQEAAFKGYLVSDWKNVTDEISRKLKTSTGSKALTFALQQEVDNSAASVVAGVLNSTGNDKFTVNPLEICELAVASTTSVHVASTTLVGIANKAITMLETAPIVRHASASITDFNRVLSTDGTRWESEEAEVEESDDQLRAMLLRVASASLTLLISPDIEPQAILRQLPPRVSAVKAKGAYSLVLSNFPGFWERAMITVRAVPEKGNDVWIASFPSRPHVVTRQQVWTWSVGENLVGGALERGKAYYLEVTSSDGVSFDATDKFVVE
jgi:hypothetical protein